LRRNKPECEPESIDAQLWGRDCCDAKCAAEPRQWMMRLYNAVQGRELKLFQRLVGEGQTLRIVTRRTSRPEAEAQVTEIAANGVTARALERFPDWSPHGDGVDCSASADGTLRCEAGPATYRTVFTWTGPEDDRRLEEVVLETR
jgi:hypothetical protein